MGSPAGHPGQHLGGLVEPAGDPADSLLSTLRFRIRDALRMIGAGLVCYSFSVTEFYPLLFDYLPAH